MKKLNQDMFFKVVLGVVALIVVCGLSFWGGIAYQKNHTKTVAMTRANGNGPGNFGGGRFRNGARPVVGTVSSVSATSITVQTAAGASRTFSITSATTVTDGGAASPASNIKTGDTVFIVASPADASLAARIMLNQADGGSGAAATGPSQTN